MANANCSGMSMSPQAVSMSEKCEFKRTKIEYLGLIVSQGQVEMDPVKVAGVTDWPIPLNQKEVQSFLGFANFY